MGDAFSTAGDPTPTSKDWSTLDTAQHLQGALRQDGGGLFPSLSFSRDEQVEANFGQKPFMYRPPDRVIARSGPAYHVVGGSGAYPQSSANGGTTGGGNAGPWRRFRAVAALIPSPLSMEAFPLAPSDGTGSSVPPPPTSPTGTRLGVSSPQGSKGAVISDEEKQERLVDRLMFLGLPVEWCLKALEEPDVKNVSVGAAVPPLVK